MTDAITIPVFEEDGALTTLRNRAAVIGLFDPRRLAAGLDADRVSDAIAALSQECSEVASGNTYKWLLEPDRRRQALAGMHSSGTLEKLAGEAAIASDDLFGTFFRAALNGADMPVESLPVDHLSILNTALQFAHPVAKQAPMLQSAANELARREFEQSLRILLPHRLFGRGPQLKKLLRYATEQPAPVQIDAGKDAMCVSGMGGAGKSALLAQFVKQLRAESDIPPPVIWLDFDRALLAGANEITMLLEFTRQLGICKPGWQGELASFRGAIRERMNAQASHGDETQYESTASLQSEMWSFLHMNLRALLPLREPVVLILDTYEEITSIGPDEDRRVRRWLNALQTEGGMQGIRPVLSGRAIVDGKGSSDERARQIILGDLPAGAARRLLTALLRDAGKSDNNYPLLELVERLGGNPLLIKILARYLVEVGEKEAGNLLNDTGKFEFDKAFAQGFIYQRILKRMRAGDRDIERLAFPGLALRRVTRDIIAELLADPCGLGMVDSARAQDLFASLARQVWLVERTADPNVVVHRKDLRRMMLGHASADDAVAIRRIHEAAERYYANQKDLTLAAAAQQVESNYHSLFTANPRQPLPEKAAGFLGAIGEDIDTVPLALRAAIKFDAGRPLKPLEVEALSATQRRAYENREAQRKLRRGEHLAKASPEMAAPTESNEALLDPETAVDNCFARGDITALRPHTAAVAERFFARMGMPAYRNEPAEDFTFEPIWRIAIAELAEPAAAQLASIVEKFAGQRYDWNQPLGRSNTFGGISAGVGVCMLLKLLGREIPPDVRRFATPPRDTINAIESLRQMQLLSTLTQPVASGAQTNFPYFSSALFPVFSAEFLDWCGTNQQLLENQENPKNLKLLLEFQLRRGKPPAGRRPLNLADLGKYRGMRWQLPAQEAFRALQIGRVPELYPAVCGVLADAPVKMLVDIAADAMLRAPLWPAELQPDALLPALERDRGRWIATLVETLDACGCLAATVDRLDLELPVAAAVCKLFRVYRERLANTGGDLPPSSSTNKGD